MAQASASCTCPQGHDDTVKLLDALAEPLVHLLRNAVDHGLESPEERAALGDRIA